MLLLINTKFTHCSVFNKRKIVIISTYKNCAWYNGNRNAKSQRATQKQINFINHWLSMQISCEKLALKSNNNILKTEQNTYL
jgi:hypothetical protein